MGGEDCTELQTRQDNGRLRTKKYMKKIDKDETLPKKTGNSCKEILIKDWEEKKTEDNKESLKKWKKSLKKEKMKKKKKNDEKENLKKNLKKEKPEEKENT